MDKKLKQAEQEVDLEKRKQINKFKSISMRTRKMKKCKVRVETWID